MKRVTGEVSCDKFNFLLFFTLRPILICLAELCGYIMLATPSHRVMQCGKRSITFG
jgi:hypothetical protein